MFELNQFCFLTVYVFLSMLNKSFFFFCFPFHNQEVISFKVGLTQFLFSWFKYSKTWKSSIINFLLLFLLYCLTWTVYVLIQNDKPSKHFYSSSSHHPFDHIGSNHGGKSCWKTQEIHRFALYKMAAGGNVILKMTSRKELTLSNTCMFLRFARILF